MKAVLLVGGLGTRLRSVVPSLPKTLATVAGRPFLELLMRQLRSQNIRELILCTGYLADQIEEMFQDGTEFGVTIEYSREVVPMGTAGAIKLAQCYLRTEAEFLVLNGDSFLEVDFNELLVFHRNHGSLATMAVVPTENASRYGTVQVEATGRVSGFAEKTGQNAPGVINAGVYIFDSAVLAQISEVSSSLEQDVIPRLLEQGIYAVEQRGIFIDIGIPEDYARAREMSDRLVNAALNKRCSTSSASTAS
jgi:D-glycero-alpha-D-manno-heptose 1-phosphate guanylyltransferase